MTQMSLCICFKYKTQKLNTKTSSTVISESVWTNYGEFWRPHTKGEVPILVTPSWWHWTLKTFQTGAALCSGTIQFSLRHGARIQCLSSPRMGSRTQGSKDACASCVSDVSDVLMNLWLQLSSTHTTTDDLTEHQDYEGEGVFGKTLISWPEFETVLAGVLQRLGLRTFTYKVVDNKFSSTFGVKCSVEVVPCTSNSSYECWCFFVPEVTNQFENCQCAPAAPGWP